MRRTIRTFAVGALVGGACACASPPDAAEQAVPAIADPAAFDAATVAPEEILDLPPEPACATCELVFGEPVELTGAEADRGTPGEMAAVVRAADGRFAAVFWGPSQSQIYIYDAAGAFESTIGSAGDGPGEFRGIGNGLFAAGYLLHAFDTRLNRRTSIDIRTAEVVGEAPSRGNIMNAAFPSEETLATSGRGFGSGEPGYPLHVYTQGGEWLRSFGWSAPMEDLATGDTWSLVRTLTTAGDGTFWSAPRREFLLEHWTLEGERLRAFAGTRDRFVPFQNGSWARGEEPGSTMYSLSVNEGLLWVVYAVAAADWQDAIEANEGVAPVEGGAARYRRVPGRAVLDYFIEVIDPGQGRVLVGRQLPDGYFKFADSSTLVRAWEDPETGNSMISAMEVALER